MIKNRGELDGHVKSDEVSVHKYCPLWSAHYNLNVFPTTIVDY